MNDVPASGPPMPALAIRYRIDAHDRLIAFNPAWDTFAEENGSPWLRGSLLAGHPLWEYVTSPELQQIFRILLGRVRSGGKVLTLPFRCDAPDLRRYMEMEICLLPGNQVEFCCRLLRAEPREPIAPVRAGDHDDGQPALRLCSWCNRMDAGGGTWMEIEHAAAQVDLFGTAQPAPLSHGICDDCLALMENAG